MFYVVEQISGQQSVIQSNRNWVLLKCKNPNSGKSVLHFIEHKMVIKGLANLFVKRVLHFIEHKMVIKGLANLFVKKHTTFC